jgi:hypothetical protein
MIFADHRLPLCRWISRILVYIKVFYCVGGYTTSSNSLDMVWCSCMAPSDEPFPNWRGIRGSKRDYRRNLPRLIVVIYNLRGRDVPCRLAVIAFSRCQALHRPSTRHREALPLPEPDFFFGFFFFFWLIGCHEIAT